VDNGSKGPGLFSFNFTSEQNLTEAIPGLCQHWIGLGQDAALVSSIAIATWQLEITGGVLSKGELGVHR
jgi:hypothetical protein